MAAHFERNHRESEKEPDPEAPPHVAIFFAGAIRRRWHDRLECHAANRAASGTSPLNLRMHWAGPDGALWWIDYGRPAISCVKIGIGLEFGETTRAAKMIMMPVTRRCVDGGRWVDSHAADRIGSTSPVS